MFDDAIIIDNVSFDGSIEIIEKYAPPSWRVVPSMTGSVFDAVLTDVQVKYWESQYDDDWCIALTAAEFLVHSNLRESLIRKHPNLMEKNIYSVEIKAMLGNDDVHLQYSHSLPEQRHQYMNSPLNP